MANYERNIRPSKLSLWTAVVSRPSKLILWTAVTLSGLHYSGNRYLLIEPLYQLTMLAKNRMLELDQIHCINNNKAFI